MYYRTLIAVVTETSLTDSTFLYQTVNSYYNSELTDTAEFEGTSFVKHSTSGSLIKTDSITLEIVANSSSTDYCFDSVIATDGHYMRIDYTFEWVKYSSTSFLATSPALTADSIPFKPTFT